MPFGILCPSYESHSFDSDLLGLFIQPWPIKNKKNVSNPIRAQCALGKTQRKVADFPVDKKKGEMGFAKY